MKKICITALRVPVLMILCLACVVQPVSANVEAECRQEAKDFEVMPELRDDYINGCIESRGGMSLPASAEEDYVPPSESDDTGNPEAESQSVAE